MGILDQPISSSQYCPNVHLGNVNEFEPICLNTMVGVSLWCARCLLFAEEAISQASPQSATNPKLAHPPLRNYGKPLHPRFSRSLQKTVHRQIFCFGFFLQNRLPVPLYWHSAFLWYRNESCFSFMHQILNGINHWLAFPPIHCVKLGFFDLMISDHHQAKHNSSMYYFIVDDPSFPTQVFR